MRLMPDKDAFLVKRMEIYNEYELISHSKLADCTMFIVDMVYRPMHLHKELELCVVLSGGCRVSTDRQSFEAGPGEILLFDAGSSHELCASGAPARLLTLQISNSFCARFYPQIRSIRFGCRGLSACLTQAQLAALRRAMLLALSAYLRDAPESPFACMAQVNEIFAMLLGNTPYRVLSDTENLTQTRNAERMHRILHYLETHYSEPVRLSEIAEREGLTQTYLSHLFREQLHIPFQDYLARLRGQRIEQIIGREHIVLRRTVPVGQVLEVAQSTGHHQQLAHGKHAALDRTGGQRTDALHSAETG